MNACDRGYVWHSDYLHSTINDTGFKEGDRVLTVVAERLQAHAPAVRLEVNIGLHILVEVGRKLLQSLKEYSDLADFRVDSSEGAKLSVLRQLHLMPDITNDLPEENLGGSVFHVITVSQLLSARHALVAPTR